MYTYFSFSALNELVFIIIIINLNPCYYQYQIKLHNVDKAYQHAHNKH